MAAQETAMLNSRNSNFQSRIFGKGIRIGEGYLVLWNIDLSSRFLEGGEAESAEDEEGGEEGEEDKGWEEAVGREQEGVDKAGNI